MGFDGFLKGGGEVSGFLGREGSVFFEESSGGGFEAGEGEVEVFSLAHRNGKVVGWLALFGELFDNGPARVAKFEHLGEFVKSFTSCIVKCLAKKLVFAKVLHKNKLSVST